MCETGFLQVQFMAIVYLGTNGSGGSKKRLFVTVCQAGRGQVILILILAIEGNSSPFFACCCFSWQVGKVTLHTKCASSKGGLHRYHPLVFRQPHLCVLDITLHMVRVVFLAPRRPQPERNGCTMM